MTSHLPIPSPRSGVGSPLVRGSLVCLALSLGAPGCVTDPEEPTAPAGVMSYTYDGDLSGEIAVAGAYVEGAVGQSFAYAEQGDDLHLFAYRHRGDGIFDILYLRTPLPTGPGTYPIEHGYFWYGMDDDERYPEHDFRLNAGEVAVTGGSGGRIRGSFTASGEDVGGPGWDPWGPIQHIEITSGSFDLPVLAPR